MTSPIDPTKPVREGEELDREKLTSYLRGVFEDPALEIEIDQFPGGHSNLTYRVVAGGKEYVLRRPPFGSKVKSAHDMGREVRVLSALGPLYPWAPSPAAFCEDESILGAKFFLMERIKGIILRQRLPEGITLEDTQLNRRLCESFIDRLAEIHMIDPAEVGLGDWGKPEGFVRRQVEGWTRRYRDSKTDDIDDVDRVAEWCAANQPDSLPGCVIHNDFKFDNLVLAPADISNILGVLDWEMSALGDPLMDLGTALCYWAQEDDPPPLKMTAFGPTLKPGMMTRKELADRYAAKTGMDLSGIVFYYVFGLFKTAVVVQQIYYRFATGKTTDPRFANMIYGVRILAQQAAAYLDKKEL